MLNSLMAQDLTQTIRGRVIDNDNQMPAIGATIIIPGTDPLIGTVTDIDGYFKLENIPVGRVSLEITYVGYEKRTLSNILVTSAKEVVLNISIIEDVNKLEEFEIVGNADKSATNNEMAIISSRTFSTEEAKRYAGSFNDPARMASNFAGVSGDAQGDNDIVVRGNSPRGILWRLEGIEIPNPNHFADEGATGGPINALNSKMLANSDFLTGAFAPEYGNATSGVFDLKLRQGNNEQREYSFGIGVLGTDITAEGPFKKGGKSSYLANYRYSSLGILDDAGIVDFGGVPKYQDAAFNLHFPTEKAGIFSVFGLGGLSHIIDEDIDEENDNLMLSRADYSAQLGFIGVNHTYIINDKTYIKSSLSASTNGSGVNYEELQESKSFLLQERIRLNKHTGKITTSINKKLNARNKVTAGIIHTEQQYSFSFEELNSAAILENTSSTDDNSSYSQLHGTWQHRINEDITIVSGMHFLRFNLNNTYSIEPRIAASWKVQPNQTLSAGFGVHSRIESLLYYTANVVDINGESSQPNQSMEIPKANHYVLGYDYQFNEHTHIKAEVYYQELYDIPVENVPNSTYSLINKSDWFDNVALVNDGKGKNYGIELTLERYFAKNFYYLFTASLYESTYLAKDGKWRKSAYNGNYNSNFLIGKEFKVGKPDKHKALTLSIKTSLLGGNRYTPIDLEASILAGETVRSSDPLSAKGDDIFYMNIAGGYRVNREKTTHEFKLEILNATNNAAKVTEYYNADKEVIENGVQLPLIPNIMYTLHF